MAFRVFVYYCSSAGLYGDVRKKIRHSAAQHCSTARQTTAPHDTARYNTAGKGSPTSIVMRMTMMLSNSIISAIVAFGHKTGKTKNMEENKYRYEERRDTRTAVPVRKEMVPRVVVHHPVPLANKKITRKISMVLYVRTYTRKQEK